MPPKVAKKKKGPSKAALENEQQIRALVSAYAGAARASLSRPSAELVKKIEEAAEKGKPLECIALAEPLSAPGTQAICDILAGRGARKRWRRVSGGGQKGKGGRRLSTTSLHSSSLSLFHLILDSCPARRLREARPTQPHARTKSLVVKSAATVSRHASSKRASSCCFSDKYNVQSTHK